MSTGDYLKKLEDSTPLDDIATDVTDEEFLDDEVKKATKARNELRAKIAERLRAAGKSYGTLRGRPVVRYKATAGFAIKKLIEENKEETAPYMREVIVEELDFDLFYAENPELAERYRTYMWGREK